MALGAHNTSAASRPAASTRHAKRKRDDEASIQRKMAQKLQFCAAVSDSFVPLQRSLNLQWQRYKTQKSRSEELARIRVAMEQMGQFQSFFGAEMDGEGIETPQVMSLHNRTDKLLVKISSRKKPVTIRTQKIVRRLPHLVKKAVSIVAERRQLIKEQQELPARHQWVPMVLWRLYADVAETADKEEEKKPLKTAMHEVLKTLKETNPYFYLQVLYQPPPEHLDRRLEITASDKLTAITATMAPFFRALKMRSAALRNKREPHVRIRYGWNQLRVTLAFARRAARHFHFVILHLYTVAMGCDAPNVHAGIIAEKAASGILNKDAELRAQLRLCRDSATSEDYLLKESYEWTPELLVYLDEWRWRREGGRVLFGFDRQERQDFLPQFSFEERSKHRRRISRFDVLAEIGYRLRDVDRMWRASRLGTSSFTAMRIEEIGDLETKIKGSLGAMVDLVYKMMLARWMDRRKRPTKWWTSLKLCEGHQFNAEPDVSDLSYADDEVAEVMGTKSIEPDEGLQDATDAESVEPKKSRRTRVALPTHRGFRRPTVVTLHEVVAHASEVAETEVPASPDHVTPKPLAHEAPIRLRDIYAWSDEDINAFSCETKRIADVRAAMLSLCEQLKWSKVALESASKTQTEPDFGKHIRDDWQVACIASHLCTLTNKAVVFAEETAMREAAAALTKKPSLRVPEDKAASAQKNSKQTVSQAVSEDPIVDELHASLRSANHNVAETLSPYDGQHSAEWRDTILSTGLATVELLRLITQDEAVHEFIVGNEGRAGKS